MEIPKYNELFIPIMELIRSNPSSKKDLLKPLAETFNLSEEDVNKKYTSGNSYVFENRVAWALSYLNMAKLVTKPQRGVYLLNSKGIELLNNKGTIGSYVKEKVDKINKAIYLSKNVIHSNPKEENLLTPQEKLYNSFENIKKSIYEDILSAVLNKTPRAFEELVILLLQKMGYGGEIKDSGSVTKYTNDGGIDGIIKEDVLGFGRIHIQAKRYAPQNKVQRDEIQKFVGALAVAQSNKGVFITTSTFSTGALEYVASLNGSTNVVLIDGIKLADYIYEYSLGMQTEQIIEIKKLDVDFWDSII